MKLYEDNSRIYSVHEFVTGEVKLTTDTMNKINFFVGKTGICSSLIDGKNMKGIPRYIRDRKGNKFYITSKRK